MSEITIQSQERNGRNAYNTFSEYQQPQNSNLKNSNDQINVNINKNNDQKNQNRDYEFSIESIDIESIKDPSSDPYSSRNQTQNEYTRRLANQISNHSNETMNNHNFMLDQEYRRRTSYHEINVDSGRQQVNALEREYFC